MLKSSLLSTTAPIGVDSQLSSLGSAHSFQPHSVVFLAYGLNLKHIELLNMEGFEVQLNYRMIPAG